MEERSGQTGLPQKATQSSTLNMYFSEIVLCLQSKAGVALGTRTCIANTAAKII